MSAVFLPLGGLPTASACACADVHGARNGALNGQAFRNLTALLCKCARTHACVCAGARSGAHVLVHLRACLSERNQQHMDT
eukprot:6473598-Alexandrium_andersonii.AAC.1